jgi:hypothetical protein
MLEKLLIDEDSLLLTWFISVFVFHLFLAVLCSRASHFSTSLQLSEE